MTIPRNLGTFADNLNSSGQASLTTGVSGTLPVANGGTNSTATATAGGVGYGTGTAHAYTSAGTSGQVLTSAGSGAPTWSTPSAGAMTLISTSTISSGTSFSVVGLAAYDKYVIFLEGITLNTNGATLSLQVGNGATPTYNTSYYFYSVNAVGINNGTSFDSVINTANPATTGGSAFPIAPQVIPFSNIYSYVINANITMAGMNGITYSFVNIQSENYRLQGSGYFESDNLNGNVQIPAQMTAIKLLASTGNITGGSISIYGISS